MKKFMDENFLLKTETAQELYHNHAAKNAYYRLPLSLDSENGSRRLPVKSITENMVGWRPL